MNGQLTTFVVLKGKKVTFLDGMMALYSVI